MNVSTASAPRWIAVATLMAPLAWCFGSTGAASYGYNPNLHIDYFGQNPPGETPAVFAPTFISKPGAFVQNGCFSADGLEFVYVETDSTWSKSTVMYTRFADGQWAMPAALNLGRISAYTPCFSPDGNTLYFSSQIEDGRHLGHLFAAHRAGGHWGPAESLTSPVNSDRMEWEVCVTPDRTLYFSSGRAGGYGGLDIYRARWVDGKYPEAERLPSPINGVADDECPFMAPNESYLVFNSWKYNPRFKGNNLYVSFKRADGSWTEPASLDQGINTDELDIYPYVTPDGKYLIFTRREHSEVAHFSRLYWVNASALEAARRQQLAPSLPAPIPVSSKIDPRCLGTYADSSWRFTIASGQTLAGEVLTAEINGDPGSTLILERLGKDEFWSHGLWFRFDPGSGQLRVQNDRSGSPEHGFAKIP
jgi:hypothetical protein